jgi:hypothetical protein
MKFSLMAAPYIVQFCQTLTRLLETKETLKKSATSLKRKSGKRSFDKVTVWDSGNGAATANFLSSLIKSLPPLHEIAKMAGLELPTYLGEMKPGDEKSRKASPE